MASHTLAVLEARETSAGDGGVLKIGCARKSNQGHVLYAGSMQVCNIAQERTFGMELTLSCMRCLTLDGRPSGEFVSAPYYEDRLTIHTCTKGHENVTMVQRDRKSTRLNSSHLARSRMPSSA